MIFVRPELCGIKEIVFRHIETAQHVRPHRPVSGSEGERWRWIPQYPDVLGRNLKIILEFALPFICPGIND